MGRERHPPQKAAATESCSCRRRFDAGEEVRIVSSSGFPQTPMKLAFFDCFSGISGDMVLGALVDAGVPVEQLRAELAA